MVSLNVLLLSTLSVLAMSVSAESGCRCGDAAYLTIPRVNLSINWSTREVPENRGRFPDVPDCSERVLANYTDAISQSVIYPASFDQNITSGVQNTVDIIKYGLQDCPDQKYFLFGYSQGATVVQKALNELGDESAAAVSSVIMVGNPYRIPGRLSNVDSNGRSDNRTIYGLFATHSLQSNDSIITYNENFDRSGKVSDICLENFVRYTF
ncbi:cutinase-domain-containing protein [Dactylonectria macrodidyma]|uniref:Cutinase-domain-containing protein n=1 Tax=Dactylonectria macrodidyma TaxID=307937 RepID=A0A9P9FKV0_9HYPO|nr:cutinase-domain-containing protein [Dactylonectria macrodidyma]